MPRSRYCEVCRRQVLAVYEWPNLAVHWFLLFLSCGMYLPVWAYFVFRSPWLCPRCGERV